MRHDEVNTAGRSERLRVLGSDSIDSSVSVVRAAAGLLPPTAQLRPTETSETSLVRRRFCLVSHLLFNYCPSPPPHHLPFKSFPFNHFVISSKQIFEPQSGGQRNAPSVG